MVKDRANGSNDCTARRSDTRSGLGHDVSDMVPPSREVDLAPVARRVVEDHLASPAAVVAGRLGPDVVGTGAFGRLWPGPDAPSADVGTIFDLASVTKPVVALTLARLERQGRLRRGERLSEVLPELASTASADVPLDLLAAHRAGLEAHIKIYAPLLEGRPVDAAEALVVAASSRRSDASGEPPPEGFAPVYSDMGYLLLGAAIERRAGKPLDEVVREEVTEPLGIADRMGSARQLRASVATFADVVAPTEDIAFRGGVVRGLVHDENAFAISSDACSGHAGLFGDARAVLAVGSAVLRALVADDGWLGPDDLAPMIVPRHGGSLLAGFDKRSGEAPSSGSRVGASTFGHLGFTGTSLWIDPDAAFVGVLLTNRVHPSREHIAIRAARPVAYDAMFDALAAEAGRLAR